MKPYICIYTYISKGISTCICTQCWTLTQLSPSAKEWWVTLHTSLKESFQCSDVVKKKNRVLGNTKEGRGTDIQNDDTLINSSCVHTPWILYVTTSPQKRFLKQDTWKFKADSCISRMTPIWGHRLNKKSCIWKRTNLLVPAFHILKHTCWA